ncbi:leucine-rich repeat-containing G-protein coupled receptor 4-like [Phlebotomus argentipes]|uniref:leucine-rich repeat-containing G-protein coupled receptor 4-like n=1 Tax=Phlebotomus argentipes TaxID=94469 RepID=UPI002892F1A1|nr:leucine-rich repeat-containing G-protein coupled receptor 4-like [Phlebotomus argentipes]XP_059620622.1 leucine-rich repeat-containing G-protein coupled receptor 4-like [Phlebotomus argentipes]
MDYKLTLGLIVFVGILSMRCSIVKANATDEEYEEYEDEDYMEESENQTDKAPDKSLERFNITELAEKVKEAFSEKSVESTAGEVLDDEESDADGEIPAQECPTECSCLPHSFVDCSRRNLTQVPANLPPNTTFIDLNHNLITTVHIDDFSNATHLREIHLRGNQLASIDKMAFAQLDRLDSVDLSHNHLKHIDPDTLAHSPDVKKVNLSGNPLEIPADASLLNAPSLEELDLSDCNISNLHLTTFTNLSGLVALNLYNNPIDENLNVDVFKPLESLQHFQSITLHQDNIPELCDNLVSIDEIRFPTFILSCFELASGSTFEESIATHPPSTVSPPPTSTTPHTPSTTKSVSAESSESTSSTTAAPENRKDLSSISSEVRIISMDNSTEISNMTTTEDSVANTPAKGIDSRGVVELSAETINNILIGIIIIAVVGLAIGVICRRDCCGIKTKMCRTRTRRPAPTDQVRPAEEVPLNKIG